ncbi:hypothetical protein KXS11_00550 [Plantibacter flavus]|uniref:hypothetical protein n=1 Tax=Plantibacter flavus TaxID=150123 RepID=UPI003F18F6D8
MAKRTMSGADQPDTRCFVEVATHPSIGIELTSGQGWIGIDQQVGHGSADALFALSDEQYDDAFGSMTSTRQFVTEAWHGQHPDRLLFMPAGGRWQPERFVRASTRAVPPPFDGEIWHHVDALGTPADSQLRAVSRGLAGGSAQEQSDSEARERLVFRLVGDGAHPRPRTLVGGLGPGSTRADVLDRLGPPLAGEHDLHAVDGALLRFTFVDDALTEIGLELQDAP